MDKIATRQELGHTYMEIRKRLLEDQSKYHELDGIFPQGYFDKARSGFKEMDL
jgi:hypothetical protein